MRSSCAKVIHIFGVLLALFVAALFVMAFPVSTAEALTYSVEGENTVTLDYGAAPRYPIYSYGEGKYYRIVSYNVELAGGSIMSLLTDGRVLADPGEYSLPAKDNTAVCDEYGNLTGGEDTFNGYFTVRVQKNILPITVTAASLSKTYGETVTAVEWVFKEDADRDNTIVIGFSCGGFAASAGVGSYPVTATTVTKGGEDVTELYDVRLFSETGSEGVAFSVTPRAVSFTLSEKKTVAFNHWTLADGESVTTTSASGANGEQLTAYYRLKTPPETLLAIGEEYEVEAYRYAVGETSYSLTAPSNYTPSFVYTEDAVVAGKGDLTIYADPSLIESREGDYAYLYNALSYSYLDLIIEEESTIWITLPYAEEHSLLLNCRVTDLEGTEAVCGEYHIEYISCDSTLFENIVFEGTSLPLTIGKRVLTYAGQDSAEVASGDNFVKSVSVTYQGKAYFFELTADLSGKAVGDAVEYASVTAVTNPNFDLDISSATLTMVKRRTGVSIVKKITGSSVKYGDEYVLAELKVDGSPVEETITYKYVVSGGSVRNEGLPTAVGSYTVYCNVTSDVYEVAEKSISLTVSERPVAAYFTLITTSKTYGTTFNFGDTKNVQLTNLYEYNEKTKSVDRNSPVVYDKKTVGGSSLTSSGAAEKAAAGTHDFDYSGISIQNYRIAAAIYYDTTAKKEVAKFTVTKAAAPAAPLIKSAEVTDRSLKITLTSQLSGTAELSESSDFSGKKTASVSNGVATFTSLTYGAYYHIRVRVEDSANYLGASAWTEASKGIPFASPAVEVVTVTHDTVTFEAEPLEDAVEEYGFQCRVGASGEWRDGLTVTGLTADKDHTIYVRAKNEDVSGATASVAVHTLRAPVGESELRVEYDRDFGTLTVMTSKQLEYRLIDSSGKFLSEDWQPLDDSLEIPRDGKYTMQVRIVATENALASAIKEIEIDTHEVKGPFSLKKFLSNWFLMIVGGVLLLATVIILIAFVKMKKKADSEELGG